MRKSLILFVVIFLGVYTILRVMGMDKILATTVTGALTIMLYRYLVEKDWLVPPFNKPPIEIIITNQHFKDAPSFDDCNECPLALAIMEKYPKSKVYVGGGIADINGVQYTIKGWDEEVHFIDIIKDSMKLAKHNVYVPPRRIILTIKPNP